MMRRFVICGALEGTADSLKCLQPLVGEHRTDGVLIHLDESMVELMLLLPVAQASALEAAAWHRGLTVGQVLRQLVRDFLDGSEIA
jgi:uncharacterized protein (UPF0212 family)